MVSVTLINSNQADWLFDQTISCSGTPTNCKINGFNCASFGVQAANKLRLSYGSTIGGSQPWTISAAVTQITPNPVVPQNGLVV